MGSVLNNRYRLDSEIGVGGMGAVYHAHDLLLDRPVAVKVLGGPALNAEGRARLLREAQSAARLNHPNIVGVYDAGETGVPGHPELLSYIVMELVEGESLHAHPPEGLAEIVSVIKQVCAALEHAHNHGIVHRDLKPENVVLTPQGTVKLMDFGLSRSSASRLSMEGVIVGTVFYLAPEQIMGQEVDARTDLYALGVMFYELVTGRLPFTGDEPILILSQHLHAAVVPPSQFRPELPPALESVILKLLEKEPAARYASAGQVARALDSLDQPGQAHTPAAIPNNLPLQLSTFVGRQRELDKVKSLLAASRLVTLTGPGGSGKTRLALQAAASLLDQFPDGAWLVELASLTNPELVPQAVISALGARELADRMPVESLTAYLRSRQLLLILDNCEHLIEACASLAETLLENCTRLKILATSREAIGITGESAWSVPALSAPDPSRFARLAAGSRDAAAAPDGVNGNDLLAELMEYEAVRLFVDRASAVQPGFRLTPQNAQAVAQICHRLDGIPLAIELAAARLKSLTVEQVAGRLDDRFSLLTVGSRTAMPRQQTLRATIDWSYDLLPEAERLLLRRLSVFAGEWTLEAAEAVCAGNGIRRSQVLDLLSRLVDKSLVQVEEQEQEARYGLLGTIHEYASGKLDSTEERDELLACHLSFFLGLAEAAAPHLHDASQLDWLDRLSAEHDNLRLALKGALTRGEITHGMLLAGNLCHFWYFRGLWSEGRDWLEHFLKKDTPGEEKRSREAMLARSKALAGLAWLQDEGESGREVSLYSESLELCRQMDPPDHWGEALALRGLAVALYNQGDQEKAAKLFDESLATFREAGDLWGQALVLFNRGWLVSGQEKRAEAHALWEECLPMFRQVGDRWGIAVTLGALGYSARQANDPQAGAFFTESLSVFRELGDKAGIATSLNRLGTFALVRDEYRQARSLFEESLSVVRDLGNRWDEAYMFSLIGLAARYQGDFLVARSSFDESLALWRETGDRWGIACGLDNLAGLAYDQADYHTATDLWEQSRQIFQELDDQRGLAESLQGLGRVAYSQGDLSPAQSLLEESLSIDQEIKEQRSIAATYTLLARVALAQGDNARARRHLQASLTIRLELILRKGIAKTLEALAQLAAVEGRYMQAGRYAGAAQALREVIGVPLVIAELDDHERCLALARNALGEEGLARAMEAGHHAPLDAILDEAQKDTGLPG